MLNWWAIVPMGGRMTNNGENGGAKPTNQKKGIAKYFPPADASNAIATVLSAICTALLVGVGIWGVIATGNSLELSERAWISVVGGGFSQIPPTVKEPLHFIISYINSGKEPATDLNFAFMWDTIDAPQNDDFTNVRLPENTTCTGLEPKPGVVASPLPTNVYNRGNDTGRGDHPVFLTNDELTGKKYVIIQGCIAYRTFEKVHKAGYCTIFQIKPAPTPVKATPNTDAPAPIQQVNAGGKTAVAQAAQVPIAATPQNTNLIGQTLLCTGGFSAD